MKDNNIVQRRITKQLEYVSSIINYLGRRAVGGLERKYMGIHILIIKFIFVQGMGGSSC